MEKLRDYSQMFGLIGNWDSKKLTMEIENYESEIKNVSSQKKKLDEYLHSVQRNCSYFKRRKRELYLVELENNFVLKPEHKMILKLSEVSYDEYKYIINSGVLWDLRDNCIELIFNKDRDDLSVNQQIELYTEFEKLLDEIPFAIRKLAE